MNTKKKIIFFIVTTVLLGTITFLIICGIGSKEAKKEEEEVPSVEQPKVTEAVVEEIDYDSYLDLRTEAHETETYAILIWNSQEEINMEFLEEVKGAFQNRKSVVYLLDTVKLDETGYSRVIDDVTEIMQYGEPQLIEPTIVVMSKGSVVYSHAGFMYKEELMDNLNAKSIE